MPTIYPQAQQCAVPKIWEQICNGAIPSEDPPVTAIQAPGCKRASKAFVTLWLYHRLYEINPNNQNIYPGMSLYPIEFLHKVGGQIVGKEVERFMDNRPHVFVNKGFVFNRHNVLSKPKPVTVNCTLVTTARKCVEAIEKLNEFTRVGFDCEMSSDSNKLTVIRCVQLCGKDSNNKYHPFVFWIDPKHPRELFDDGGLMTFLQNNKPKFTVGGSGDCAHLQAAHGITVGGVEECQAIASAIVRDVFPDVHTSCAPSMRLLVAACGVPPSKVSKNLAEVAGGYKKISGMFDKPLSDKLKQYAAFDAFACLRIYEELEKIRISNESLEMMLEESVGKRKARLVKERAKRNAWIDGML
jgi:hypothetical protein